ncbi:MAG TPA: porin [Gammaproteobacteria bacterium]|nr:porin [Gammaproteobacteria bacterium]
MRRVTQAVACAMGLLALGGTAQAANWLKLQGTERPSAVGRAHVWGFIQPEYQYTKDTKLPAGTPWAGTGAVFNQQRPDLSSNSSFNVLRARIGVRGTGFPLDDKVNYFVLAEFGNNGITKPSSAAAQLTDASITLNQIPHARIRIGEFKYPGSEEGLMAIHVFNYINFTNVTNQMLLERHFAATTGANPHPYGADSANEMNAPVGAFRDIGVQVFDWFDVGDWEHTYAVMVGNGNGINRTDNNNNKDLYLYWSSAKIFGGKGPRRQDWKTYAWYESGKRTIGVYSGSSLSEQTFDRKRYGIGTTFLKGRYRAAAEYMWGKGMIFNGTSGGAVPGTVATGGPGAGSSVAYFNVNPNEKAHGWYIDGGYKVLPNLELDLRYDQYNRNTKVSADEREFKTTTVGAQYFFNKKSRMLVNYEFRSADAPNLPDSANPNKVLDSIDNRLSAQLLIIF